MVGLRQQIKHILNYNVIKEDKFKQCFCTRLLKDGAEEKEMGGHIYVFMLKKDIEKCIFNVYLYRDKN